MVTCGIDSGIDYKNLINNCDVIKKENTVKLKSKLNQDGCTNHKYIKRENKKIDNIKYKKPLNFKNNS
jgi:hypothetical protein